MCLFSADSGGQPIHHHPQDPHSNGTTGESVDDDVKWMLFELYVCKFYHSVTSVLAAISMHKGYAFVQFSNPVEAKNAADGEDGRLVLNQNIGKIQLFLTSFSAVLFPPHDYCSVAWNGKVSARIKGQEIT